ncbi:MAG TPA: nitroreductase family deazaflavin-dependent oxidoreductase [Terriglobales bacterium]|nr:nitroreductase family deazaflavin-dependent oxidoreductase [Terriglobales bacterium]
MSEELSPFLQLTTTGRRSGQPRQVELWYAQRDGCFYVIAEFYTANWVLNLRSQPHVRFSVLEEEFDGVARVVDASSDGALNRDVQRLFRKKYGWSEGLVVELRPAAQPKVSKKGWKRRLRFKRRG